ncbi:MAG: c-type cytochrome biogenesis protein CcmI [Gammaproteobacteria bacterium]|nr:c-type cytochrome biogenesis protein CcmI [Rhodocyclaceae bacterium]MBU3908095.1 c-type cytochrome biogenesis protein CcmI [Gammaproteobacteria bacterium]MBU3988251.1 c-type cytochrome biogenesis protein CcmI [Gammaproteobacteria bacterium]MBU4005736.1 c-type cytochrome biogenesis protein CcmI [Gammaproteobacteria bacterium]MBU4021516.1 c-type cytochrome biogenesis protein CcmI [Gammaproteobacteria bacterium]
MTGFAIGAALLVLATLALLLLPFFRRPKNKDLSRQELNAAIYRDQFAELERDRSEGALSQDDYVQARAELQRRLIEDSTTNDGTATTTQASRAVPTALAISLPLVAVLLYLMLGSPAGLNPPPPPAAGEHQFTAQDIERMVSKLAANLENNPDNPQGWAMLGRSYRQMGRMPDAVKAYERAISLGVNSADLYVEYADTLASVSGFDIKVRGLIDKALQLEPTHPIGLWLRGTAAYEAKQYEKAIADWDSLLKMMPPESEDAGVLRANIAETRKLLGKTKP